MALTKLDDKVLLELGLDKATEGQKEMILKIIDELLEKRFVANLLTSLPEDKQKELEQKIGAIKNQSAEEILELVIDIHPTAKQVMEKSAQEIIDELKQGQNATKAPQTTLQSEKLPVEKEPEELDKKSEAAPTQASGPTVDAPKPPYPETMPDGSADKESAVNEQENKNNQDSLSNKVTEPPLSKAVPEEKPTIGSPQHPAMTVQSHPDTGTVATGKENSAPAAQDSAPQNNATGQSSAPSQDTNQSQPDYYQSL